MKKDSLIKEALCCPGERPLSLDSNLHPDCGKCNECNGEQDLCFMIMVFEFLDSFSIGEMRMLVLHEISVQSFGKRGTVG